MQALFVLLGLTAAISFLDSVYGNLFEVSSGKPIRLESTEDHYHHQVNQQFAQISKVTYPDKDDTTDLLYPSMFGGIITYAHFPFVNAFKEVPEDKIDIAILGAPFDTGVSYRSGARFGPEAIRSAARRLLSTDGPKDFNLPTNPYNLASHNYSIVDCGDVPLTPFDNRIALDQLYRGLRSIHKHTGNVDKVPRVITLGGDHTITLMGIRSIHEALGKPIHVIHFDSHIDTWDPKFLGGGITDYMKINHGTFLHYAHEKGFIADELNYHVGIRAPYVDDIFDPMHDAECGFNIISMDEIDTTSIKDVIKKLRKNLRNVPVYITVDIDVLDPAYAPGTGTMETGGLTTRELIRILDGLRGLDIVGCDVVEVSPPYDTNGEITSLAATAVIDSFLKLLII